MLNSLANHRSPAKASDGFHGESGDLFMATSIGAPIARRQAAPIGYAYRIATMTPLEHHRKPNGTAFMASAGVLLRSFLTHQIQPKVKRCGAGTESHDAPLYASTLCRGRRLPSQ